MELNTENVSSVFTNCLFTDDETADPAMMARALIVDGVSLKVGFHPGRIKENSKHIKSMLDCLPDSFKSDSGGGMSFLNAIEDNNGVQWTSLHTEVDKLVILGLATFNITFLMPREMWKILPGGMPYLVVNSLKQIRKKKMEKIEKI